MISWGTRNSKNAGESDQAKTDFTRYLHIDSVDSQLSYVRASCSQCGCEFSAERKPEGTMDDMLCGIMSKFDAHKCKA